MILAWRGDELSHGQAQHGVHFDFEVKFDLEGQGQSPPKTIGTLTKVFYTYGPNLVILAWTGDELSRGQACGYRTHRRTHRQTDAGNDNTRRPKLASGKNYWFALWWCALRLWNSSLFVSMLFRDCFTVSTPVHMEKAPQMWNGDSTAVVKQKSSHRLFHSMTVSQYDHVVPYTDLGDRGYFGVNAALVNCLVDSTDNAFFSLYCSLWWW